MIRPKHTHKYTTQVLCLFLLGGCFSPVPNDVEVIVQGEAAKRLVRGIASSDFLIYNLNRSQVNDLTSIYNDYVLSQDFLIRGDYTQYQSYINKLLTPNLRARFQSNLPQLIEDIDYDEAESRYKHNLMNEEGKLTKAISQLDEIESVYSQLMTIEKKFEENSEAITAKKLSVREKINSLERDVAVTLDTHNSLWREKQVRLDNAKLSNFKFVKTSKSTCERSFKNYDIQYHTHNRCFVISLPNNLVTSDDSFRTYKRLFMKYVDLRVILATNTPMIEGTLEFDAYHLNEQANLLKSDFIAAHGSVEQIKAQREMAKGVVMSLRSSIASMKINKYQLLNTYLNNEIDDLKATINQGVSLSNPDSPLYQQAMVTLNTIRSQTLDKDKKSPLSKDAMMILTQVNAKNRAKFPIFIKPNIVEQKKLKEVDTYPLYLKHGNIEHVKTDGIVHTIVFLVGESFINWKNGG